MSGTGNSLAGHGDSASLAREAEAAGRALGNVPDRPAELGRLHELLVKYTAGGDIGVFEMLDLATRYPILAMRVLSQIKRARHSA